MTDGKFPLGQLVATRGAIKEVPQPEMFAALSRHVRGDWGNVNEEDKHENDISLRDGLRLLSAYLTQNGTRFWIITEADRSATTVLLPEEY